MSPAFVAWFWLLVVFFINLATPFLPVHSQGAAIFWGVSITLLYVAGVIGFSLALARGRLRIRHALVLAAAFALVWLAVEYQVRPALREFYGGGGQPGILQLVGGTPTPLQQLLRLFVLTNQNVALMGLAACAGTILARMVRHANMLVPICVGIALIDIWGVLGGGIVSQLMTNKATAHIAAKGMTAATEIGGTQAAAPGQVSYSVFLPQIGVGDFLFAALLLSILVNLAMNATASARLMWILASVTLLAISLGYAPALPGLVPISVGALLPNLKYSTYTREEKFALLYAGLLVLVLTTALYFGFKSALPKT